MCLCVASKFALCVLFSFLLLGSWRERERERGSRSAPSGSAGAPPSFIFSGCMPPGESVSHPERAPTPTFGMDTESAYLLSPNRDFGVSFYVP